MPNMNNDPNEHSKTRPANPFDVAGNANSFHLHIYGPTMDVLLGVKFWEIVNSPECNAVNFPATILL